MFNLFQHFKSFKTDEFSTRFEHSLGKRRSDLLEDAEPAGEPLRGFIFRAFLL